MKKLIYIALLITFLLVPLQNIYAESFADANDIFKVISPLPNSKVGGTIDIEWTSFDDDQTAIPYYIQLLDGATCKTTSYGRINSNSASNSSNTTNNKVSWDTHKTVSTQSLSDGNYCLQICSAFKNTDAYYSICNARVITVVNVNKLPTISSTPANLTINETEAWQYQIQSTDVDSDSLKYYLVFAPDFLEINSQTGLIRTKENTTRISSNINIAEYRVVVGVDDGVSGTTTQEFTIRVEKGRTANPTTPLPTEPIQPTPEPQNIPSQISINSPKENNELSGVQNFIEWSVYDPDGIEEITLNYSSDLESWTQIISKQEDSFARYSWDVTEIPDGKYYLQIIVKDKKAEVVAKVSKAFLIKNTPIVVEEKKPLIINLKPENEKVLTESPQNITGDFAPAEGEEIDPDSFKITLNDKDISEDCIKNLSGFQCTIKDSLTVGEYSIKAEIQDLNANKGTFESKFTLQEKKVETPTTAQSGSNSSAAIIILVIVILLILLVGLPWFFISYSKRKLKTTKTNIQQTSDSSNYAYPQASVTFSEQAKPAPYAPIPQPVFQPAPQKSIEPAPIQSPKQSDQSRSFDDFMSSYSFGTQQVQNAPGKPAPVPPAATVQKPTAQTQIPQPKQIGDIKPKQSEPKATIKDTFSNLTKKVSNFIPKSPEIPKTEPDSQPVLVNNNPNLSQNIQNAYSSGTSTNETPSTTTQDFVEPAIIDEQPLSAANQQIEPTSSPESNTTNQEYVTPTPADSSEEELKKMYPELYGAVPQEQESTNTSTTNTQDSSTDEYYEPKPKD